ncbi:MAG TPA: 5'/3'-nucleotidase SurE [Acidimicrobiales bacterium]|nr:5'/3'-nucleotidase SurE [Acidimicrobiales bacterium]
MSLRILVTNDDGVDSEGLHVLARRMQTAGDVVVVAPDKEYSGASAALGSLQSIHPEVHNFDIAGIPETWAVSGPPALCVTFARLGAFGPPFDLVVAGINPGANVGRSVYHSGTVGAAVTARNSGISALAVSQAVKDFGVEGQGSDEMLEGQCWSSAAAVAEAVARTLLGDPPAMPVVANVNLPNLPLAEIKGWRHTRLAIIPTRSMAAAALVPKAGHPGSFRVRMTWGDAVSLPPDTDGGAIERGQVSLMFLGHLSESDPAPAVAGAVGDTLERLLGP